MMTYPPQHRVHFSAAERLEGIHDGLDAAGRRLEVVTEPSIGCDQERRELAGQLSPDTAVICNSIYQAHALRDMAEQFGKIPGRDFGLICCDDQHQLDRIWPTLSRVSYDRYAMGLTAADMMRRLLKDGLHHCESVRLDVQWLDGQTVGRSPSQPFHACS